MKLLELDHFEPGCEIKIMYTFILKDIIDSLSQNIKIHQKYFDLLLLIIHNLAEIRDNFL